MKYRTVCILGGTGFVGTQLVSALASRGYQARVLSRNPYRHRALSVLPTVRMVRADVHDLDALSAAFTDCDAVINLIGILHENRRQSFRAVHVELPRKVAQACRTAGVRRLLHMSALKADAANAPSRYLRTKGEGEAALRVHAGNGVDYTIFQPSVIFGPGDSFINRFATLLRVTPWVFPLARAEARFQPVFVDDVAEAFVAALESRDAVGARYPLCGPREYSLREIVEFVAAELGVRRRVVALPDALARLQALLFEFVPGKPFTRDNFRSLTVDAVCGAESGLERLGIIPSSLELIVPQYLAGSGHRNRLSTFRGQLG